MLKIHSFLRRVKKPVSKYLPADPGKCKLSMAIIAYMLITILFLLSPDYIYGTGNTKMETLAKAETTQDAPKAIVEETANEAIVRNLNSLGFQFILCNLTTDGRPDGFFNPAIDGLEEGKSDNTVYNSNNTNSEDKANLIYDEADSKQAGAVASQVDSSSTKEKVTEETVKADNTKKTAKTKTTTTTAKAETTKATKTASKEKTATETKAQKTNSEKTQNSEEKKKYVINASDDDVKILQRIVEAEATGEDMKGKILVANVIINRVKDDDFPNSIEAVVFQKNGSTYQFSPIKDQRYWSVKVTSETKKAVERALEGEDYSKGALYFSARSKADKNSMSWFDNNLHYLFQYGGHEFFR